MSRLGSNLTSVALGFSLGGDEPVTLGDEHAQWLIAELMASGPASVELAQQIQRARFSREPVETSDDQRRILLELFNRSSRPRSNDLRALEIALHGAVYTKQPSQPSKPPT